MEQERFVGVSELLDMKIASRNTLFKIMKHDTSFPKGRKVGGTANSPLKFWLPDVLKWIRGEGVNND